METDGGGWTVIQRRESGEIDFYRDWEDYEQGFGYLDHEFWLGLSKIYRVHKAREFIELRIELTDFEGNTGYATYTYFEIGDNATEYTLTSIAYNSSSTANDGLTQSHNMKFSTRDNDNDQIDGNCAEQAKGAWWYNECSTDANLNGVYHESAINDTTSVSWYPWKNSLESLKSVEIKIRPSTKISK